MQRGEGQGFDVTDVNLNARATPSCHVTMDNYTYNISFLLKQQQNLEVVSEEASNKYRMCTVAKKGLEGTSPPR